MSLTTVTETTHSQIPFGQVGNLVSSSGVFRKQSVEQITDTEVSYCNISFSDFDNTFKFEITKIIWDEFSDQIVFKLEYEDKFSVNLKLIGYWELEEEQKFQLTDVDWNFEEKVSNPTSVFVLNTLLAIFCLSNKVKVEIPTIDYYFGVSVPSPLNTISEILQYRQTAYRLMVIEKTFQISLPFPKRSITAEEIGSITYCYHAIFDREFDWTAKPQTILWIADKESLSWLPETNKPTTFTFMSAFVVKSLFGVEIPLGLMSGRIEKFVIDNYEEARAKLLKLDGSIVEIKQRSVDGIIKVIANDIPKLPPNPWSKKLQKLIDLEKKLDSKYFDKYLDSFSNAFEGLTEEQSRAITERPTLEDNAFNF